MNELLKNLKEQTNVTYTTNGATTYASTLSKVYDLFATGAAMRGADEDDCVRLFVQAYEEDATMALKCLFYLRDIRGGQGERRFFRACIKWLGMYHQQEMENLIAFVSEYGRYDDLGLGVTQLLFQNFCGSIAVCRALLETIIFPHCLIIQVLAVDDEKHLVNKRHLYMEPHRPSVLISAQTLYHPRLSLRHDLDTA